MQLKLPPAIAEKFSGKSPEEICAILEKWQPAPPAPQAPPAAPEPPPIARAELSALAARLDSVEARLAGLPDEMAKVCKAEFARLIA